MAESSAGARVAPHPQAYEHPRQAEAAAEHAVGYSVAQTIQAGAAGVGGRRVKAFY